MQKFFLYLFIICPFAILQTACVAAKKTVQTKTLSPIERSIQDSSLAACHFGFQLSDIKSGKVLFAQNADKLFIPASNMKILTLYAALKLLPPDSLPAFRYAYAENGDLIIRPLADATFLHPKFEAWQGAFYFLKNAKQGIHIDSSTWQTNPHGAGWMWDDFSYDYSAERAAFPVLGNGFFVKKVDGKISAEPPFFQKNLLENEKTKHPTRVEFSQTVFVPTTTDDYERWIPFYKAAEEGRAFLERKIQKQIHLDNFGEKSKLDFLLKYSCPTDTVLRKMMVHSDNVLAEHILLQCAAVRQNDTLSDRKWAVDSIFTHLLPKVRWVDGSGLSRYDLLSPEGISNVLGEIWRTSEQKRLFYLFPSYGEGSLYAWNAETLQIPQLYAKSGSMSGVYCISGFLQSKSGRWLSFSCMSNGFVGSNAPIQAALQKLLTQCSETF